jgi:myosin heavy subunit
MRLINPILIATVLFIHANVFSQDSAQYKNSGSVSSRYIQSVSKKTNELEQKLDKKSRKALTQLQKQEAKMKKKLAGIDSVAAKNIFSTTEEKYKQLEERLKNPQVAKQFVPLLDSINTSLKFLEQNKNLISQAKEVHHKLQESLKGVENLQTRLRQAEEIKKFLKERKQYLKEQLEKFGFAKELKKLNKQAYYYSQTVKEIKNVINDPKKIEKHAIALLRKIPAFNDFMARNSFMASIFGAPANTSLTNVSLAGLQTRVNVQQTILNSFPASSSNTPQQYVQQQLQTANTQLNELKKKIAFVDFNGNAEATPDFKPNGQKGKPLLKRIELGTNVQFGKTNRVLPTTSEFAVSVGYKLNNNGVIGIGSSYKLGLGNGFQNIQFTNQGVGLRSFLDWKIKGGFYISGGYEKNYLPALNNVNVPVRLDIWQESGLIGLVKKYKLRKNKQVYTQILFDFLSYKNIPRSQPIIFRTGWNF